MKKKLLTCLISGTFVLCMLETVSATAIGIDILPGSTTGTTGDFTAPFPYSTTSNTVMPNAYNDNILWVWNEQQNVTLSTSLLVDWVADPSASFVSDAGSGKYYIDVGTIVSSHYVQWDPTGTGRVIADIAFDSEIFGYIDSDTALFASDSFLGRSGVDYNDFTYRGLESSDLLTVSAFLTEANINWNASNPGDWIRLITAYSPSGEPSTPPIPEPATILFFGTGLVALIGSRIRKKKK